ncbi:cytochrome c oxidase accessory protein CcoG [Variovorax sp. PCZ-1]|uniref:cytochrome c oxidase accessory protein CcoG n=1 Tax=Variovorax sp. PCZ-1 TaxID=2835533 RepID=UPI0020BDC878|nr:cytochrome c oxidase accessory protein CcoG [Variovorax sp. PCZ-1]
MFVSEATIHPRSVQGKYARLRWLTVWLTQLVFYGMPWLQWGQRQAVLFDLEARRFYLFDLVLYPQDFIYLAVLLIICALSLFLVTAVAGRVWCGYACPQTVYSEIFMWIERKVEGDRQRRIKLDAQRWNAKKLSLKGIKHLLWLSLALWTGLTFVAYFTPMHTLLAEIQGFSLGLWEMFWILFYGFATYGNAGFMREQVCKYMCPYARFQSAMFDKDTLIISYDERRGEPRGSRGKGQDARSKGLGDCVDCTLCVQVCPTGIDIRKGLQYECIGCAACIDVCNGVMKKLDYAPGLIRYSTQQALANGWSNSQIWRRLSRPRVLMYSAVWGLICAAWLVSITMRHDFRVDVVRDRAVLARIVAGASGGMIENVYRAQLMNATDRPLQLQITANGLPGLQLNGEKLVKLEATESEWVVLRLDLPAENAAQLKPGSHPIELKIYNPESGETVLEKSAFYIPR